MRREQRYDREGNKLYPFSVRKHQHDIEFRYNRLSNEIRDMQTAPEFGGRKHTVEEFDKAWNELEDLKVVRERVFIPYPVAWLTGKEYRIARDCVAWAQTTRDNTQAQRRE